MHGCSSAAPITAHLLMSGRRPEDAPLISLTVILELAVYNGAALASTLRVFVVPAEVMKKVILFLFE